MTDNNRIALTILAGAIIGGFAGYLLYTDRGRRLRAELLPQLDELMGEVRDLQDLALKVRNTATESWRQMEAFVGDMSQASDRWAEETRRH